MDNHKPNSVFALLKDVRNQRNQIYNLLDITIIIVLAILYGVAD
ncbi:hypothetical protein DB42_AZ00430 [Neochlamydia sp. EPS4]|nr:hypothetical protein DB42_AZ00430 [Neochlamydia sp. EPS4]